MVDQAMSRLEPTEQARTTEWINSVIHPIDPDRNGHFSIGRIPGGQYVFLRVSTHDHTTLFQSGVMNDPDRISNIDTLERALLIRFEPGGPGCVVVVANR